METLRMYVDYNIIYGAIFLLMKYNLGGIKATLKVSVLFSFFKCNLATRYHDARQNIKL